MKVYATYIGKRLTTKKKLAHFWDFAGETGIRGYKKQIVPATIGESWEFERDEKGQLTLDGAKQATHMGIDSAKREEWTAQEVINVGRYDTMRAETKLANRKNELEIRLAPLQRMVDTIPSYMDRCVFIDMVARELGRRR